MIGKIDSQVLEKFKVFQEHEKGEVYRDLDLGSVEFESKAVGNIFDTVRRGSSPRPIKNYIVSSDYDNVKFNWLKISDVTKSDTYLKSTSQFINSAGRQKSVLGKKGDFLITNSMTVGVPIILDIETCFHDGFLYLGFDDKNKNNYFTLYLYQFFIEYRKKLIEKSNDGIVKNINTDIIKTVLIPIPKPQNNYTSCDIQKAIVEFLEFWKVEFTEVYREKIAKMQPILDTMKQNFISSTFALDSKIVESFNEFAEDEGIDVKLEDIEFNKITYDDIAKFNGGSSEYKKPYYTNPENSGEYNLMTGSLEPVAKIKPLNESDIIKAPKLSFNKDNDAGSTCFYHEEDFIVGGHHYWMKIKPNYERLLDLKYIYFVMKKMFEETMFYQSKDPKANSKVIASIDFSFPKDTKQYSTKKLQNLLVSYWEMVLGNFEQREKLFQRALELCDKIDEAFLYRTFSKIQWSK